MCFELGNEMNIFPILWRLLEHKFCVHLIALSECSGWRISLMKSRRWERNNLFLSKELSKAFLIYSLSFSSLSCFIAFHIFSILSSSIYQRTHVCHPNLFRFDSQSLFNSALSSRAIHIHLLGLFVSLSAICYVLHILLLLVDEKNCPSISAFSSTA